MCSLGYNDYVYWDQAILKHYLAGIQYAIGDLKGVYDKPNQPTAAKLEDIKKVQAALPDKAAARKPSARPQQGSLPSGGASFVHGSIPLGCRTVDLLGKKTGAFDTVITFDPSIFTPEKSETI